MVRILVICCNANNICSAGVGSWRAPWWLRRRTFCAAWQPGNPGKGTSFQVPQQRGANTKRGLIEALGNSKVFQDYERAFTEATGLPVALRAVESWQLPHHGQRNESPFCALVLETSRACASCLQVQEKLAAGAAEEAAHRELSAGLCDTAVPVRLGDRLIGFLADGPGLSQDADPGAV